jgi:hypothetical protein
MPDSSISALTAVVTPAGTDELEINQAGASKKMTLAQIGTFEEYWIRANATRALTSSTSEQKIFGDPTNGRLTLPTGTYWFWGILYLTAMSATSGNAAIDLLGAGTAVCEGWAWHAVGIDASTPTSAATQTGSFTITQQSVASIVTAGTGTAMGVEIKGDFEVTTGGTLIPSISLVTAAAATVAVGTIIRFKRLGAHNTVSSGPWD